MGRFVINGGVPLFGRVRVSGSKNAALAVIFASLITDGISEIDNLPDIGDVRVALLIAEHYGAQIERDGARAYIDTRRLKDTGPPCDLAARLRASTYLLGATLVRFGRSELLSFGGCNFSPRPIDMHLDAMLSHGASIAEDGSISCTKLLPSDITFSKCSVGATVNALLLAAGTDGKSVIRGIALEPHILNLIEYLKSCGAKIILKGNTAYVVGGRLSGGRVEIGGDMIEAGTYLALSSVTGGGIKVFGVDPSELSSFLTPFQKSGVSVKVGDCITMSGMPTERVHVSAEPYPGFPTDLQPIAAPLLTLSGGVISDSVWHGRFGYLGGLSHFGVSSRVVGSSAEIFPSELSCGEAEAPDLRGGMALVMAALASEGISTVHSAQTVLRGYERLTEKLGHLGAEIAYFE